MGASHALYSGRRYSGFWLMSVGLAEAADPTLLAETGGYLLGNAHRCGVSVERVERAMQ